MSAALHEAAHAAAAVILGRPILGVSINARGDTSGRCDFADTAEARKTLEVGDRQALEELVTKAAVIALAGPLAENGELPLEDDGDARIVAACVALLTDDESRAGRYVEFTEKARALVRRADFRAATAALAKELEQERVLAGGTVARVARDAMAKPTSLKAYRLARLKRNSKAFVEELRRGDCDACASPTVENR